MIISNVNTKSTYYTNSWIKTLETKNNSFTWQLKQHIYIYSRQCLTAVKLISGQILKQRN